METLPLEMVQQVSQHLTPQDLARCCGVSHSWREIFNQDVLWKPHCDPALQEPLSTTLSVVEPAFVAPRAEDSTLVPVSPLRLAFMREKHLWNNWKHDRVILAEKRFPNPQRLMSLNKISFLTDTLLVVLCSNTIEIWDVNLKTAKFVIKIDHSFRRPYCSVFESRLLVVQDEDSLQVYSVDIPQNSIMLNHVMPVDGRVYENNVVKQLMSIDENRFVAVYALESNLIIFDLERGEQVWEELSPVVNGNLNPKIFEIKSYPTSDDLLIAMAYENTILYHIYSLKQQRYLPGPLTTNPCIVSDFIAINKHYVALGAMPSLKIIDYHSSEVLFENRDQKQLIFPEAYQDGFVFVDYKEGKLQLKLFSLATKTIATFEFEPDGLANSGIHYLKTINKKLILLYNSSSGSNGPSAVFEPSGRSLKQVNIPYPRPIITRLFPWIDIAPVINNAFTRGFDIDTNGHLVVYYFW